MIQRVMYKPYNLSGEKKDSSHPFEIDSEDKPVLVGESPAFLKVLNIVAKVAPVDTTVLLLGESGTGKELIAKTIHQRSNRSTHPFVAINCGAITPTLLESELFGHVKGAFTNAHHDKKGLIQHADQGTLFLDEIGDIPLELQVKLLRFLQENEIHPVGSEQTVHVDTRIVAATSRDLSTMIQEGAFREDLYYRLNVVQIDLPPLRHRQEDISVLSHYFLRKYSQRHQSSNTSLTQEALEALQDYSWPGNIRELENCIERMVVMHHDTTIGPNELPPRIVDHQPDFDIERVFRAESLKSGLSLVEKEFIRRVLEQHQGSRTQTAKRLQISQRSLLYKIKEHRL